MVGGDFTAIIIGITVIVHFPALVMLLIGFKNLRKDPKKAKIWLIVAGIYLIIGLGFCSSILN